MQNRMFSTTFLLDEKSLLNKMGFKIIAGRHDHKNKILKIKIHQQRIF